MKLTILCVGKIKEKFYRDAVEEYCRRLSRYCRVEILEVEDEKTPDRASTAQENQIREREGERLLAKLREDACIITLEISGKKMDSVAFSGLLERAFTEGGSHVQLVIGGSLGLCEKVCQKADYHISFSDMTFPHQLMRVILCEQLYRGFRIMHNEPYHK